MKYYMGIVIKQSLDDEVILQEFDVVARRTKGSWEFLYVKADPADLVNHIKALQQHMVSKHVDCWYNHYFKDENLIVVYQDKYFELTTSEETWAQATQYGLLNGIPEKQLDFNPRTLKEANQFFNITYER